MKETREEFWSNSLGAILILSFVMWFLTIFFQRDKLSVDGLYVRDKYNRCFKITHGLGNTYTLEKININEIPK